MDLQKERARRATASPETEALAPTVTEVPGAESTLWAPELAETVAHSDTPKPESSSSGPSESGGSKPSGSGSSIPNRAVFLPDPAGETMPEEKVFSKNSPRVDAALPALTPEGR